MEDTLFGGQTSNPPDDSAAPVFARNQIELAAALGCERKTVQRWLKEKDNPGKAADGRYNVVAWKKWAADQGKQVHALKSDDKQSVELRSARLKLQREEMELDERRGELMGVDEVVEVITGLAAKFAASVTGRRHEISTAVVGLSVPEATKRIGRSDRELLEQLAIPDWVKKKAYWQNVSARLSGPLQRLLLSIGP